MRYTKVAISNYKSFRNETRFELGPGFNVIVGKNNAGKTALLEVLSGAFGSSPHRSPRTVPIPGAPAPGNSASTFEFAFGPQEILSLISPYHAGLYVPALAPGNLELTQRTFGSLLSADTPILAARYSPSEGGVTDAAFPAFGFSVNIGNRAQAVVFERTEAWGPRVNGTFEGNTVPQEMFPHLICRVALGRIYTFKAERLNVARSPIDEQSTLKPNASNLPNAVNYMQTHNYARFTRYTSLVRAILPDVQMVTSVMLNNMFELMVWTSPPENEREDLAFHLSECGTGVSQILAILDIIVNSEFPRVIIIDEPQSFLHPGAIAKLFEIIRTESRHEHQIIVTTHSPGVIGAADPSTILHVTKEGMESRVTQVDANDRNATRHYLHEIGARLSDVFGADRILWVEGPTEAQSLPHVLRTIEGFSQLGLKVTEVRATGDLDGRHADATFEIYSKLSEGAALIPPAVAFLLDREDRTEATMADYKRRAQRIEFLPRKMYENYLVDAAAILDVFQRYQPHQNHTLDAVDQWITDHRWLPDYFHRGEVPVDRTIEQWNLLAHGGKFLIDLFRQLAGPELPYEKVAYGEEITKLLLEAGDAGLIGLQEFLTPIVRGEQ